MILATLSPFAPKPNQDLILCEFFVVGLLVLLFSICKTIYEES